MLTKDEEKVLNKLFQRYKWVFLIGKTVSDSVILYRGNLLSCTCFSISADAKTGVLQAMAIALAKDEKGDPIVNDDGHVQRILIT